MKLDRHPLSTMAEPSSAEIMAFGRARRPSVSPESPITYPDPLCYNKKRDRPYDALVTLLFRRVRLMTGSLSTDLLVIYLPAALAVIMGILGILRGTKREVVVSGAIVLASLITLVWGVPWATDIHDMLTNFSVGDIRNVLIYVVMILTVLVIGYLLGSALVPRTRISPLSRFGGLLIGVANGLAIGGYFIRSQYESGATRPHGGQRGPDKYAHYQHHFPLTLDLVQLVPTCRCYRCCHRGHRRPIPPRPGSRRYSCRRYKLGTGNCAFGWQSRCHRSHSSADGFSGARRLYHWLWTGLHWPEPPAAELCRPVLPAVWTEFSSLRLRPLAQATHRPPRFRQPPLE